MRFFIIFLLIFLVLSLPLTNASIKEDLQPKLNKLEKLELNKYKTFLPLSFKISSMDTKEEFLVKLDKKGKFEFLAESKIDVLIQGNEENLLNVLNSDDKNLKENVLSIDVKGESLKGKIAVLIGERIIKMNLNKNKSFSDKLIGAIIYPITGFFIKN